MVNLGDRAKDKITGYAGIVIAITTWLNGCVRVVIQSQDLKDGKPIESQAFDVEQVELVQAGVINTMKPTGGPMPAPTRNPDPK